MPKSVFDLSKIGKAITSTADAAEQSDDLVSIWKYTGVAIIVVALLTCRKFLL